jgi:murein L,D-transpeptidase YafK
MVKQFWIIMTRLTLIRLRLLALLCALSLSGCGNLKLELAPHLRPISTETMSLLGKKGFRTEQPLFIRVFKEESELEVWKQRDDGTFHHFRTYPICTWSGDLGPKVSEGDKQAPEGFYAVPRHQMNPNSQFHLSFNLGFPNAYDRSHGRTGSALMVHGKCKSAGCYAITDTWVEEVYALGREAFIGGQGNIDVHIFPFRMTDSHMALHASSPHAPFWSMLKEAFDDFETTRRVPTIAVCERRYLVNPVWRGDAPTKLEAEKRCPAFDRVLPMSLVRAPVASNSDDASLALGPKKRALPVGH